MKSVPEDQYKLRYPYSSLEYLSHILLQRHFINYIIPCNAETWGYHGDGLWWTLRNYTDVTILNLHWVNI